MSEARTQEEKPDSKPKSQSKTVPVSTTQITDPVADNYAQLERACLRYMREEDLALIDKAYRFAAHKHKNQNRRSGEPYINHPVEVSIILAEDLRMGTEVICAALLHDTVEDTDASLELIQDMFGESVAELVDGVTKLTSIDVDSVDEKQALNLRKMFLAMSKDMRVIIIKLADRLHNMRTLSALPPDRQKFKAQETMDVYAPLADRLGISSIKWELEDLAFFYLDKQAYQRVARMVQESRPLREKRTQEVIQIVDEELKSVGIIGYQIIGRPKHLWSIYQKMQRKQKSFSEIYDLIALRIILDNEQACYSALGAVSALWPPIPNRFKDYISLPKANGYQSIHTTVIGPEARPVEIQIRSKAMDEQAEYGIAAHWLYKKNGNSNGSLSSEDKAINEQINRIKRSLDWAADDEIEDASKYLHDLKIDLFEDEIFVFTPKAELISLREGSTPLDFAYAIHTEIGNHCTGACVNDVVVPLNTELMTGDRIKILTNPNAHPSRDWLTYVKTPSARSKIKHFLASMTKNDDTERGRSDLAKELRKLGYGISTLRTTKAIQEVYTDYELKDDDALFAAIGRGHLNAKTVAARISDILQKKEEADKAAHTKAVLDEKAAQEELKQLQDQNVRRRKQQKIKKKSCGVVAKNDPDLMVHLAHCCSPLDGDPIVGFITRGRGVSVHRANCPNVKDLMQHPERMIEVQWNSQEATEFQVEIIIEATDRIGLLRDILIAMSEAGGNIINSETAVSKDGVARLRFTIAISTAEVLDLTMASISRVDGVFNVRRIMPGEGGKNLKRKG